MQLSAIQFEKLSGYFIDLAKVWFATGVIGFFTAGSPDDISTIGDAIMSIGVSVFFLIIGLKILNEK